MLRTGNCWLSELRWVDWISVSSKSPKTQNLSPITKWMMKGVCSCWVLTAVSWPLTVHGPPHLNCGTGMTGQQNKAQLQAVIAQQRNFISRGFCMKVNSLQHRKSVETQSITRLFGVTNFPQSSALTPQIEEESFWILNKRSQSQVTSQPNRREMLHFCHTLRHCFNTLSLSVMVQYSNWMPAVRGDVENEANFCWQQRICVTSSTSRLLFLWFNPWIVQAWLLLMLILAAEIREIRLVYAGLRRFAQMAFASWFRLNLDPSVVTACFAFYYGSIP